MSTRVPLRPAGCLLGLPLQLGMEAAAAAAAAAAVAADKQRDPEK